VPFKATSLVAPRVALPQQQRVPVCKAAPAVDIAEFGDDVDLNVSRSSAPMASENVRLRIRMRGYDINLLTDAVEQVRAISEATGAQFKGPVMLPTRKKLYCVLRSPHVNKDSREHFEIRIHHRLIDMKNLSAQTVEAMMQWVPPPGLEVEASIV